LFKSQKKGREEESVAHAMREKEPPSVLGYNSRYGRFGKESSRSLSRRFSNNLANRKGNSIFYHCWVKAISGGEERQPQKRRISPPFKGASFPRKGGVSERGKKRPSFLVEPGNSTPKISPTFSGTREGRRGSIGFPETRKKEGGHPVRYGEKEEERKCAVHFALSMG